MNGETSKQDGKPLSVLLVEDAAAVRQRLGAMITESPGLRLAGAAAGVAEARALFDAVHPDAILLDLGLPDGSGMDVLRYVREKGGQTVVMILSNYLDSETHNRCRQLDADFLFNKSNEFELAIETLRALAERM